MGLKINNYSLAYTTTSTATNTIGTLKGKIVKLELMATTTCTAALYASSASTDQALFSEYILGSATTQITVTTAGVRYYPASNAHDATGAAITNSFAQKAVYGDVKLVHTGNLANSGTYANTLSVIFYYDQY